MGDKINIYPVKGYSITILLDDKESIKNAPYVSLLDDKAKIVSSRLGKNRFRVAGTAEFNGYNKDIRADRINPLIKSNPPKNIIKPIKTTMCMNNFFLSGNFFAKKEKISIGRPNIAGIKEVID